MIYGEQDKVYFAVYKVVEVCTDIVSVWDVCGGGRTYFVGVYDTEQKAIKTAKGIPFYEIRENHGGGNDYTVAAIAKIYPAKEIESLEKKIPAQANGYNFVMYQGKSYIIDKSSIRIIDGREERKNR